MQLLKITILVLALTCAIQTKKATTAQDDLVKNLPGFDNKGYDMYSGMLDVTDSGSRQLHYILVESMNDVATDPLVLWLNGGPGCSSQLGFIQEIGPFQFQGVNTFLTNMESTAWNQNANVLYIEGPPGVGYSINNDKDYKYSDINTADDFLSAFLQFRTRFSSVLNFENPFWLSGESYAGMYVPYFTKAILDYNKEQSASDKINVKGILLGNNVQIMKQSLLTSSMMNQYVEQNFVNPNLKDNFYNDCGDSILSAGCVKFLDAYANISNNTDHYQIYNYTYSYGSLFKKSSQAEQLLDYAAEESELFTELRKRTKNTQNQQESEDNGNVTSPEDIIKEYFNLEEVKEALNIPEGGKTWNQCNMLVNLKYKRGEDSNALYQYFVEAGLDVLIFSGNSDGVVPWQYTDYCIQDLQENPEYGIKLTETDAWRQWKPLENQQVGGMVKYYETTSGSQFVYAMVRAAGHEVPMYQPEAAYHMFNNFINNQPI